MTAWHPPATHAVYAVYAFHAVYAVAVNAVHAVHAVMPLCRYAVMPSMLCLLSTWYSVPKTPSPTSGRARDPDCVCLRRA